MRSIIAFICALFIAHASFAAAVPVSSMQNALSGVVQKKMQSRGFASNDPRYGQTLIDAGSGIAGAAATATLITMAGITAPAWVTAGLTIGISSALAYGISLAANGLYQWIVNPDGTVSTTNIGVNTSAGLSASGQYCISGRCSPSKEGLCSHLGVSPTFTYGAHDEFVGEQKTELSPDGSCGLYRLYPTTTSGWLEYGVYISAGNLALSWSPSGQCEGINLSPSGGVCPASNWPDPSALTGATVADAVAAVPSSERALPANPAIVAALANQAWLNAASQPDYDGLPYDASNPITTADAAQWQASNPSSWPTVGDFISPQSAPSGGTASSPFELPNSASPVSSVDPSAPASTATNPSTEPLQNLGPDPGIGAPSLEATPTAQMILAPLLGLFPSLRNFVVPSHDSVCPKPSVTVFNKVLVLDAHCTLLEPVRSTLYAVMAFVWVAIGMFIILRA